MAEYLKKAEIFIQIWEEQQHIDNITLIFMDIL
jgi:hypothetical protein